MMVKFATVIAALALVSTNGDAGHVDQAHHGGLRKQSQTTRQSDGPPDGFFEDTFDLDDWETVSLCVKPTPDCGTDMPAPWGNGTSELMTINGTNATINGWYVCINPLHRDLVNVTWSIDKDGQSHRFDMPGFEYNKKDSRGLTWGFIGMCFPHNLMSCTGEPCPEKYAEFCGPADEPDVVYRLAYPQDYLAYLRSMNISHSHGCVDDYKP